MIGWLGLNWQLVRGTLLSRGIQPKALNHRDVLDVAYALFLEPTADDPKLRAEIIEKLNAPLPGSEKAKQSAKRDALAQMGLTPEMVRKRMSAQQARNAPDVD